MAATAGMPGRRRERPGSTAGRSLGLRPALRLALLWAATLLLALVGPAAAHGISDDCKLLSDAFPSLDIPSSYCCDWGYSYFFLSSRITCDDYGVTEVLFRSMGIQGRIPTALGDLKRLQRLSLADNRLSGAVPDSLTKLTYLTELMLDMNYLSGAIPSSIGDLTRLEELYFHDNLMAGSIPVSIGNLRRLRILSLYDNAFDGTVPSSIGNLTSLQTMYLYNNNFYGVFPSTIAQCLNLGTVDVSNNTFTAPKPAYFKSYWVFGAQRLSSPSPTPSRSPSPSASPSTSASRSPSPSASPSKGASSSPTASISVSPSVSVSSTPTASASPYPSSTPTPSISPQPSPSAVVRPQDQLKLKRLIVSNDGIQVPAVIAATTNSTPLYVLNAESSISILPVLDLDTPGADLVPVTYEWTLSNCTAQMFSDLVSIPVIESCLYDSLTGKPALPVPKSALQSQFLFIPEFTFPSNSISQLGLVVTFSNSEKSYLQIDVVMGPMPMPAVGSQPSVPQSIPAGVEASLSPGKWIVPPIVSEFWKSTLSNRLSWTIYRPVVLYTMSYSMISRDGPGDSFSMSQLNDPVFDAILPPVGSINLTFSIRSVVKFRGTIPLRKVVVGERFLRNTTVVENVSKSNQEILDFVRGRASPGNATGTDEALDPADTLTLQTAVSSAIVLNLFNSTNSTAAERRDAISLRRTLVDFVLNQTDSVLGGAFAANSSAASPELETAQNPSLATLVKVMNEVMTIPWQVSKANVIDMSYNLAMLHVLQAQSLSDVLNDTGSSVQVPTPAESMPDDDSATTVNAATLGSKNAFIASSVSLLNSLANAAIYDPSNASISQPSQGTTRFARWKLVSALPLTDQALSSVQESAAVVGESASSLVGCGEPTISSTLGRVRLSSGFIGSSTTSPLAVQNSRKTSTTSLQVDILPESATVCQYSAYIVEIDANPYPDTFNYRGSKYVVAPRSDAAASTITTFGFNRRFNSSSAAAASAIPYSVNFAQTGLADSGNGNSLGMCAYWNATTKSWDFRDVKKSSTGSTVTCQGKTTTEKRFSIFLRVPSAEDLEYFAPEYIFLGLLVTSVISGVCFLAFIFGCMRDKADARDEEESDTTAVIQFAKDFAKAYNVPAPWQVVYTRRLKYYRRYLLPKSPRACVMLWGTMLVFELHQEPSLLSLFFKPLRSEVPMARVKMILLIWSLTLASIALTTLFLRPRISEYSDNPYSQPSEVLNSFLLTVAGQAVTSIICSLSVIALQIPLSALAFVRPIRSGSSTSTERLDPAALRNKLEFIKSRVGKLLRSPTWKDRSKERMTDKIALGRLSAGVEGLLDFLFYFLVITIGLGCIVYILFISAYFSRQENLLESEGLNTSIWLFSMVFSLGSSIILSPLVASFIRASVQTICPQRVVNPDSFEDDDAPGKVAGMELSHYPGAGPTVFRSGPLDESAYHGMVPSDPSSQYSSVMRSGSLYASSHASATAPSFHHASFSSTPGYPPVSPGAALRYPSAHALGYAIPEGEVSEVVPQFGSASDGPEQDEPGKIKSPRGPPPKIRTKDLGKNSTRHKAYQMFGNATSALPAGMQMHPSAFTAHSRSSSMNSFGQTSANSEAQLIRTPSTGGFSNYNTGVSYGYPTQQSFSDLDRSGYHGQNPESPSKAISQQILELSAQIRSQQDKQELQDKHLQLQKQENDRLKREIDEMKRQQAMSPNPLSRKPS